jgi:hypothetical protein
MTRTVIKFEPLARQGLFRRRRNAVTMTLDRAPTDFTPEGCIVNLKRLTGATPIDLGQKLAQTLVSREPAKSVLGATFHHSLESPPAPVYFHVRADAADAIPWEQLHLGRLRADGVGFCALDTRWPIGRIASQFKSVPRRTFETPLRIVAVLSAAGQTGVDQLQALVNAIDGARIQVSLHVVTGQEQLLEVVPSRPYITSAIIKGTSVEFCRQISGAKPHLLHLLCHGGVEGGERKLNFGLVDDFDRRRSYGSLSVTMADLIGELKPACDPWLVVLAACETAETANIANGRSLAHQMVDQGMTAVIGMRRLVDVIATNRFCTAFYPEVLAEIRRAVEPPAPGEPGERTVDWARSLTLPRRTMSEMDRVSDSWLDPVLYAQDEDLRVTPPSESHSAIETARLLGILDKLEAYLRTQQSVGLDPGAEDDVRKAIAEIKALLGHPDRS